MTTCSGSTAAPESGPWRLELGEAVESPPLVLGDQLYQVLPSGKLLVIDLKTGESRTTVNLGMPLSQAPVSDESGPLPLHRGADGIACSSWPATRWPARRWSIWATRRARSPAPPPGWAVPHHPREPPARRRPLAGPGAGRGRGQATAGPAESTFPAGPGRRRRRRARSSGRRATRGGSRRTPWEITPARRRSARWPGSTRRRRVRPRFRAGRARSASSGWRRARPGPIRARPRARRDHAEVAHDPAGPRGRADPVDAAARRRDVPGSGDRRDVALRPRPDVRRGRLADDPRRGLADPARACRATARRLRTIGRTGDGPISLLELLGDGGFVTLPLPRPGSSPGPRRAGS